MDDYKNCLTGSNIYRLFRGNYVTCRMTRSKDIGTSCLVYVSEYLPHAIHNRDQVHRILSEVEMLFFMWKTQTSLARLSSFMSELYALSCRHYTKIASFENWETKIYHSMENFYLFFIAFS